MKFYKNYFVTGDYAVAGVGLYGHGVNGVATGTINMTEVPAGADIVAAYLYWETVESTTTPSSIKGTFDSNAIVGLPLGNTSEPACWSSGGTSPQVAVRTYRADVLRYFKIDPVNNVRLANAAHVVILPDSGGVGNGQTPHTYGATLVVIYRLLAPGVAPLKAVVIYDGDYTLSKGSAAMMQTVSGFYQASGDGADKMTQVVGNGQQGFNATLSVNGKVMTSTPFEGLSGGRWDNYTTSPIDLSLNASSVETQVVSAGNQVCLSWGAIITSTDVRNSDGDGILDALKTPGAQIKDPNSQPLPDLYDMGARLGQKDVFIQIDWMQGSGGHLHIPKLAALDMVAAAFRRNGIYLHFDVGNNYQQEATPPYYEIVPAGFAQGGHVIQEAPPLDCMPSANVTCSYIEPYSVVSWKKGFLALKNGFQPALPLTSIFSHTRKDFVHEMFMGHALSGPADAKGKPLTVDPASVSGVADRPGGDLMITLGLWRTDDPATDQTGTVLVQAGTIMHELGHNLGLSHAGLFRTPNCMPDYPSIMNYLYQTRGLTDASGIEHIDYSFGTLAALNENSLSETTPPPLVPAGFPYRIRFYGPAINLGPGQTTAKAHCDGTRLSGDSAVRLETSSPSMVPDWNNDGKVDADSTPLDINFNGFAGDPAKDSVDPTLPAGTGGKRWFVDSNDWGNLNLQQVGGRLNVAGLSADVGQTDLGQTDLGQTDLGQTDLGQTDLGQTDLGQTDLGQTDLGQTDLGDVDYDTAISTLDPTGSDPNSLLAATDMIDRIILNWGAPSIGQIRTYTINRTDPDHLSPKVFSVIGTPPLTTDSDMVNDQNPADSGPTCPLFQTCYNTFYTYYLTATDASTPPNTSGKSNTTLGIVEHVWVTGPTESFVYGSVPNPLSPQPTITGPYPANFPSQVNCSTTPPQPVSVGVYPILCTSPNPADGTGGIIGVTYMPGQLTITGRPLAVTATGVNKVYDGSTTATVTLSAKPANGDVLTYSYSGATFSDKNVGNGKMVTVTGISVSGTNAGNYTFNTTAQTTANITPRPLTISAAGVNKVYNGNTVATVTLSDNRISGDIFVDSYASATFADKNVGTGKPVAVSGITISGADAGNYTFNTTAQTTANITPRPLTISATGVNKVYNGNTVATVTLSDNRISGDIFVDSYASATFADKNVGTGKPVAVSGITISGTDAGNYTFNTTAQTTANITPHPLTITAQPNTKYFDDTTIAAATPLVTGLVGTDTVTGLAETYANEGPGSGITLSVTAYTVNDGNGGQNYSVITVTNNNGVILPREE